MCLQELRFCDEPVGTMETEFCLALTIAHSFAKVQQTLVLTNILDILFNEAQFMKAHFKIVEEISHCHV